MTGFIAAHGVYAVFLLMAVDAVFPAASELVMLVGGALATAAFTQHVSLFGSTLSKGAPTYVAVAIAGTLGYVLGSLAGWAIGRYGGRALLERRGRWFHLTPERLDRAERWFDRWGTIGVLLGRVTPIVRSFVSIPAGVFEMPLAPYTLLTVIGSAVWAFALAGAGWAAGTSYGTIDHDWRYVEIAVVLGVLLVVAVLMRRLIADPQR
jgi:membrane protein DedA with SNARE-associated domain